ncbi:hypothetical protein MOQ_008444, partial [Trypanosoma cruzi marinkellei]
AMQHNRALQRRHIRHVDEGVGHQARRALAEAANPQLRAARKHAVAQRHVQRVSERVHRAQVHRHSDRPAEHHRVKARRRPHAANHHGLRQRHATHATLRTTATATGHRRRHVERQARVAHADGAAAAHAVGERRRQRIKARQRCRATVARHHTHGEQAGQKVVTAAPQHPAPARLHCTDTTPLVIASPDTSVAPVAVQRAIDTAPPLSVTPDSDATDDASLTAHTSCRSSHPPAPTVPPLQRTSDDATAPSTPTTAQHRIKH